MKMLVDGKEMRSLWYEDGHLKFIDQRKLPSRLEIFDAVDENDVATAITEMVVRGAPAIGCAAAYGLAISKNPLQAATILKSTRPTAHDLFYAIEFMLEEIRAGEDAIKVAHDYTDDIIDKCNDIFEHVRNKK